MNMLVTIPAATAVTAFAPSVGSPSIVSGLLSNEQMILQLERKLHKAWADLGEVCDVVAASEEIMSAWTRRNPKPKMRDFTVPTVKWDSKEPLISGSEAYKAYMLATDDANSDLKAAMAEHSENMRRWKARKEIAEQQSGSVSADALEVAANDEITRLGEELAGVRADTMAGFAAKARVAHMSDDVEDSIKDDLLVA